MPKKVISKITKKRLSKKVFDDGFKTLLFDVSDNHYFFCVNGDVYKNLEELSIGLKSINKKHFSFHVGRHHNHFASWVYDCIGDIKLAEDIRNLTNQKEIAKKVSLRVSILKKN